jgi:DNA phosphorothioation-dependent restriction protein DptG
MWGSKVGRLKKVKGRLKIFYSGISKFTNILAEVHGNRTHPIKIIAMLDQYIMLVTNVKVKEKLKDKDLLSVSEHLGFFMNMLSFNL